MDVAGWLEIALFAVALTALTPIVGGYLARVFTGGATWMTPVLGPLERRLVGADPVAMDWRRYARAVLLFSLVSGATLYALLLLQGSLPLNPEHLPAGPADLSLNTAVSFVTNTNWQFYAGETTLSNLVQMAGLAVQNFVSAAVGLAVAIALIRGLASRSGTTLGNFWQDLFRGLAYVLVPASIVLALFYASQGVVQTLAQSAGGLAVGPVASQEAIKLLGTNGGGFYSVNSAMPFENPTALTNVVQMLSILVVPAALTSTFGRMVGSRRQGWTVYAVMLALLVAAAALIYVGESSTTPALHAAGVDGANFEGKDVRFGIASSSLFAAITTAASSGAVNAAMESLSGLSSAVPMAQMMTGEVIFGGVGSGLYGMLLFVLLGVFLSGLMVGRTPEYLGKKIEAREIRLVAVGTLAVPLMVLVLTAVALATKWGGPSIFASGPQGFSETLYAYTSQGNNNGSAFAGYTGFVQPPGAPASTITYANVMGAVAMLLGRFVPIVVVLAVAGSLAGKRVAPAGLGTLRTDTGTFAVLLVGTILLVALLTFVPALLLGPVVQGLTDQLFA